MTITQLLPGRKKLTSVYIDGEFAMQLDTRVLEEQCIRPGTQLDDDRLHELVCESEYRRAKEKALWLISSRDYSRRDLFSKLRREASEETAESVCDRMEELGLINYESYARRLASDLIKLKKMAPLGVRYKLIEKGIDKELAEEILEEFEVDPVEQITELIERKYSSKLADEKDRRRTAAALGRLGYRWGDIKTAMEQFEDE